MAKFDSFDDLDIVSDMIDDTLDSLDNIDQGEVDREASMAMDWAALDLAARMPSVPTGPITPKVPDTPPRALPAPTRSEPTSTTKPQTLTKLKQELTDLQSQSPADTQAIINKNEEITKLCQTKVFEATRLMNDIIKAGMTPKRQEMYKEAFRLKQMYQSELNVSLKTQKTLTATSGPKKPTATTPRQATADTTRHDTRNAAAGKSKVDIMVSKLDQLQGQLLAAKKLPAGNPLRIKAEINVTRSANDIRQQLSSSILKIDKMIIEASKARGTRSYDPKRLENLKKLKGKYTSAYNKARDLVSTGSQSLNQHSSSTRDRRVSRSPEPSVRSYSSQDKKPDSTSQRFMSSVKRTFGRT